MVAHQHIGVNIALVRFGGVSQFIQVKPVVRIGVKDPLAIVPTLNNMLWQSGYCKTRHPCHYISLPRSWGQTPWF